MAAVISIFIVRRESISANVNLLFTCDGDHCSKSAWSRVPEACAVRKDDGLVGHIDFSIGSLADALPGRANWKWGIEQRGLRSSDQILAIHRGLSPNGKASPRETPVDLCRVGVGRLFLVSYLEAAADRIGPNEYLVVPDFYSAKPYDARDRAALRALCAS
jgi:hypothetical protein